MDVRNTKVVRKGQRKKREEKKRERMKSVEI
jgi:hypothetical protein